MKKLVLIMTMTLLLSIMLVACDKVIDNTLIEEAISEKIDFFCENITSYNVEGLLSFLDEDNFILEITEGGRSYQDEKDYLTLKAELEEDEEKEALRRLDPPEGVGYKMEMELGTLTFSKITELSGQASASFAIHEETVDFKPEAPTDTGTITCSLVKVEDQWLCQHMAIDFEIQEGIIASLLTRIGFGLGALD